MVNLLGTGPRREARLLGVAEALGDPAVHLHLYDKREVFEGRKMGHLTALGATTDQALAAVERGTCQAPLGRRDHADGGRPMSEGTTHDRPVVGIVGGSRSDFPTLEAAVAVLDELGVPSELKVVSAHRTPDRLFRYAEEAAGRGIRVIIAGAGGAAHLPGMLASKTALPVVGVPIPTEHLGGLDSLLSIVQMPRGVPVATVGIGNATNAGPPGGRDPGHLATRRSPSGWPPGAPARPRPSSTTPATARRSPAPHPPRASARRGSRPRSTTGSTWR